MMVAMQQLSMNWAIRLEKHSENGTTRIERTEIFTKSTKVVIPRPETDALKAYIWLLISKNKNSALFKIRGVSKRALSKKCSAGSSNPAQMGKQAVCIYGIGGEKLRIKIPEKADAQRLSPLCI